MGIGRARVDAASADIERLAKSGFWQTAFSHGIARRSVLLGVAAGTISTAVVVAAAVLEHGTVKELSGALTLQAFVLPMMFGLLSQTLSYRRAVDVIAGAAPNGEDRASFI